MTTPNQVYKNILSSEDDPQANNQYMDDRVVAIEYIVSGGTGHLPITTNANSLVRYTDSFGAQADTNILTTTTTSLDDGLSLVAIDNSGGILNIGANTSIIDFHNTPVINFTSIGPTGSYIAQPPTAAVDLNAIIVDNAGSELTLEFADATHPGIVSIAAQSIAGVKTFTSAPTISSFGTAGIVHNSALGALTSSTIVNADVSASAAIVDTKLATISTAGKVSNSATTATAANTPSTIILRDGSGNFAAGQITADLIGNATTSTTTTNATNFSGSLVGDVTGTQTATVVSTVGGSTAAAVNTAAVAVAGATSNAVNLSLVQRSSTAGANFGDLLCTNLSTTGLINMPATASSTTGVIYASGTKMVHNIGTNNMFVGLDAGNFGAGGAARNSAFGSVALASNLVGNDNAAFGYNALNLATGGTNSAFGSGSLAATTVASQNSAFGYQALTANTAIGLNAFGYQALKANTTGTSNCAFGLSSLAANTTGTSNSAFGNLSLQSITTSNNCTAFGYSCLKLATGNQNTGVGSNCLAAVTSGTDNTAVGYSALANTTVSGSTAVGYQALNAATTGNSNVAVGYQSLSTLSTGNTNTAVGYQSLTAATTGFANVAIGYTALNSLTTGAGNIAIGYACLSSATAAVNFCTGVGYNALAANTALNITAVGYSALAANTSGTFNTACGFGTLLLNTTGTGNTAIGYNSLATNVSSSNNTAVGTSSLTLLTGANCTAVGANALAAATTAAGCTALGYNALASSLTSTNNTAVGQISLNLCTGISSTAVGGRSLQNATTGDLNTAIGFQAGTGCTTGGSNIFIGANAGGTLIATGSNNIIIGNSANLAAGTSNTCYISQIRGVTCAAGNGVAVFVDSAGQLGTVASIRSRKDNIEDLNLDTNHDILMKLQPKKFDYKECANKNKSYGLIVDEVIDFAPDLVVNNSEDVPETIAYQHLPIMILGEVQRQNDNLVDLYALIEELERRLLALENKSTV